MRKTLITILGLFIMQMAFSQITDFKIYHNYEAAKTAAEKEGKMIFLVFTSTDWSSSYLRFNDMVLDDPVFKQYAADRFVILKLDFPMQKQNMLPQSQYLHNLEIAMKFKQTGVMAFPKVLIVNGQDELQGQFTYYQQSADQFVNGLQQQL